MLSTGKFTDLKKRLWFLVGALIVYRIGAYIPVPGIDPVKLAEMFGRGKGILDLFNMFSGGALERLTVFALGVMPYISASIILQLAAEILPSLKELKKEGESGRRKITQYTRYATVVLALMQSVGVAIGLSRQGLAQPGISPFEFHFTVVVCLVTGTMFLMWLGEQITERGIGNGISLIICAGIIAGVPGAVGKTLDLATTSQSGVILVFLVVIGVALVTAGVVFMERAQRKVLVNYAKRQVGNKVMQGQSTHLPLKVNMAGVIPPIFASSLILFPATLAGWFSAGDGVRFVKDIADSLTPGRPLHAIIYAGLIIFFCFFYTALMFNPKEISDNLKRSGAFIPGIRPGEQTAKYLEKVVSRLILIGAIYITVVCLLPELLMTQTSVPFYFGGTSLLIIVVVVMDFMAQVQSYVLTHQYDSLLKKANFKGGR